MKKLVGLVAAIGMMTTTAVQAGDSVSISGSTSVAHVMEVLAENYSNGNNKTVEVQSTGSSAGIRAATDGTSMIGMSSRDIADSESKAQIEEIVIARDGIAIALNNDNKVDNLTQKQIAKIYRGEITNWQEVGGENSPIVVVTRENASGTRGAFEDIMSLKREVNGMKVSAISPRAQVANGNGMIKTIVANNPFAIGFVSLGSIDESLRAVKVNGIEASHENIAAGKYTIARPFIVLMKNDVASNARDFVNYILSDDGQAIIANEGYISI